MTDITLQIPISKSLKEKAEKASRSQGFSLQQAVKTLLERFSKQEVTLEQFPAEEITELSPAAEKRYKQALKDIKAGRGITKTKNLDELFVLLDKSVKEYNATHIPHEK